jgi:hypothetical protein
VMPMQGSLSIERMCQLARVSRASFYRSLKERVPRDLEKARDDSEHEPASQPVRQCQLLAGRTKEKFAVISARKSCRTLLKFASIWNAQIR